jgi:flagellar FliJ protein
MRSKRLTPLLDVVTRRQDDAARGVASSSQHLSEQERRFNLLQQYRDEYASSPGTAPAASLPPWLLANRQAFRERLDAAVQEQASVVETSRQRRDLEQAKLVLASRETKVLEQLAASYRAQEALAEAGRTQKALDDLGARRALLRPSMTQED